MGHAFAGVTGGFVRYSHNWGLGPKAPAAGGLLNYSPFHSGLRFSMKAQMPSLASASIMLRTMVSAAKS